MPPAARITDPHACAIPLHAVNVIAGPCCPTVLIGFLPAARQGDLTACGAPIVRFSPTVEIGNQKAARMGDNTGHGGVIVKGEPTVLIGEVGKGECDCMKQAAQSGAAKPGQTVHVGKADWTQLRLPVEAKLASSQFAIENNSTSATIKAESWDQPILLNGQNILGAKSIERQPL